MLCISQRYYLNIDSHQIIILKMVDFFFFPLFASIKYIHTKAAFKKNYQLWIVLEKWHCPFLCLNVLATKNLCIGKKNEFNKIFEEFEPNSRQFTEIIYLPEYFIHFSDRNFEQEYLLFYIIMRTMWKAVFFRSSLWFFIVKCKAYGSAEGPFNRITVSFLLLCKYTH